MLSSDNLVKVINLVASKNKPIKTVAKASKRYHGWNMAKYSKALLSNVKYITAAEMPITITNNMHNTRNNCLFML